MDKRGRGNPAFLCLEVSGQPDTAPALAIDQMEECGNVLLAGNNTYIKNRAGL
jgi:hypothetical protein